MTEHQGEDYDGGRGSRGGSRRAETSRRGRGCVPMLLVGVLLLAGIFFGGHWALDKVKSLVGGSPDYGGPGSGRVVVQVHQGDTAAAIGRTLKSAGVVKSVDAFIDAASSNSRSRSIGQGYYAMKKQMKASAALAILIDPHNLIRARVTIPEGTRVSAFPAIIAKATKNKITKAQVTAALAKPGSLGLPSEAGGDPEGFLFPATYDVVPGETATQLLRQMASTSQEELDSLGLDDKAKALGYTPRQIVTIASILEYEARRDQDYPKVARAIYNRLRAGMALQSDATVAYANNLTGTLYTSAADRAAESPYNTYLHTGLPPGPIGSPGLKTLKAALDPTPGPWLYWVVVNLRTGETLFNTTFAGHQQDVAKFHQYCQTSDAC
ncbi:MAG: endolytic transglycosylase MltG [Marmoricola sp.]